MWTRHRYFEVLIGTSRYFEVLKGTSGYFEVYLVRSLGVEVKDDCGPVIVICFSVVASNNEDLGGESDRSIIGCEFFLLLFFVQTKQDVIWVWTVGGVKSLNGRDDGDDDGGGEGDGGGYVGGDDDGGGDVGGDADGGGDVGGPMVVKTMMSSWSPSFAHEGPSLFSGSSCSA